MTPTLGTRTGIGHVVHHMYESFKSSMEIQLRGYTLSLKAKSFADQLPKDNIFIPYPATVLLTAWKSTHRFDLSKQFQDVDIVHATNYLAPPTKKPLLITIHDLTMLKYPELVSSQVRSLSNVIKKRLKDGAFVHVPSEAIKKDVLEYFGVAIDDETKIHVVPFALPKLVNSKPSEQIQELSEGEPYIVCIGALEPRKNHVRLISAFEKVHKEHPHVRLMLVGPPGPASEKITQQIELLSPSARSKVAVLGKVSDADRTFLLKNAHLLAYPSIYEGFGLPLLEAMATDTPILTSSEGSLPEIARDAAHFVNPFDEDDIAEGIIKLLDDEKLRDQLVTKGKLQAKNYSWEQTTSKLTEVYKIVNS